MKKLYSQVLLVALIVFAAGSCKPFVSPVVLNTPTSSVIEDVLAASPTVVPSLHSPTFTPVATISITPDPLKLQLKKGWASYSDAVFQNIKTMTFDLEGNLWAGGPGGLLRIRPDGTYKKFTEQDGFGKYEVTSISATPDSAVWVGTWGGGAWRFDGKEWQVFTTSEGLWDDYIHAIAFIPEPYYGELTLFFGTRKGLSIYAEGRWSNYINASYGLPHDEVLSIITGHFGELLVGTRGGLIDLGGDQPVYTTASGLAGNHVNSIIRTTDCSLWFGTGGGASHFDGERWSSYTSAEGLAAERVITVAAALDGSMWFGTDEGASHLDEAGWTTYTTADGLVDDHVDSIAVSPDEAVWFGTPAGLTRFAPTGKVASEPAKQSEEASTSLLTSRLVYVKDGNIWLWNNDKKEQLTKDGRVDSLKFSGDGSWIAFTRARAGLVNELWVVRSDGRDERLLVSAVDLDGLLDIPRNKWTKGVAIFNYTWVPGTHSIAYETRREIEGTGTALSDDLRLVDVETGEPITHLASGQGGKSYYSPDGLKVAIVTPQNISIMSADGEYLLEKVLEYPKVITYSEYSYYPKPVWSPDSRYLRVAIPFEDALKEPAQPTEIWHIQVPALSAGGWETVPEQPTLLVSLPTGIFLGSPVAFSPDLSHIAYSRRVGDSEPMQVELHLANSDGTNNKVIQTETRIEVLSWAPDGQHFAFRFGHPESGAIAGLDGSIQTLGFNPLSFAWVDGETFTHVMDLGCAAELWVQKLNGESQVLDRMWKAPVSSDSIK